MESSFQSNSNQTSESKKIEHTESFKYIIQYKQLLNNKYTEQKKV